MIINNLVFSTTLLFFMIIWVILCRTRFVKFKNPWITSLFPMAIIGITYLIARTKITGSFYPCMLFLDTAMLVLGITYVLKLVKGFGYKDMLIFPLIAMSITIIELVWVD